MDAAFAEIYLHGFQAASIANILKKTDVTKGAFFHYFPTKAALGYAVVEEVIAQMIRAQWVVPLSDTQDPIQTILDHFSEGIEYLAAQPILLGCPLNNLAQEMSPIDKGFQERTQRVFDMWVDCFANALDQAKRAGQIKESVETRETALFLVSQIEGVLSLSKNAQSADVLRSGLKSMELYLDSLRATA